MLSEKHDDDNDLTGSKDSQSLLDLCTDYSEFFKKKPTGETYIFRSLEQTGMGGRNTEISVKLENTDLYTLDLENAVIYAYNAIDNDFKRNNKVNDLDDMNDNAENEEIDNAENMDSVWVTSSGSDISGIQVSFDIDTVKIQMDDCLESDKIPTPVLMVSVPIRFSYVQESSSSEVTDIPDSIVEWVNTCTVPNILTDANQEEMYTKTYDFDSFMDKLTGYKAIVDSGNNLFEKLLDSGTEEFSETVNRLNIIIVADERN